MDLEDDIRLFRSSKTEMKVQNFDEDGKLLSEVHTIIVEFHPIGEVDCSLSTGFYL